MRPLSRVVRVALLGAMIGCSDDGPTVVVPVASVRFITVPTDIVAGAAQTIEVELLGEDGERASGARDQVTLTVSDGAGFIGPSSIRASNGLARFNGLALTHAGTGLYLSATVGAFTATTGVFTVSHAAASGTRSTATAPVSTILPTEPTPIVFLFADAYGNPIPSAAVTLSAPAGASFTPATGTTDAEGKLAASFRSSIGGPVSISANVAGAAITFATPLMVCANATLTLPGSATGALSAISCMVSGRPTAYYRFTMPSAGGAAITVTSTFAPRLDVRTDPPLENAFALPFQVLPTEWLLAAGTYQLRIGATTGTGSYSLTGAVSSGNSGCVKRYLAATGAFAGQALANGDCDYGDGTFVDKYVIYSANPCSFRLHSTTFTNYLFLVNHETGGFIDGRGGDDHGVDVLYGLPSCSYQGLPVEIWVLPDFGETGGAYTLTYTLFPLPGQRADVAAPPIPPRVAERARVLGSKRAEPRR